MKKLFRAAKQFIRELSGPLFYSTKSYSQEGEDLVVKRLFDGRTKGFYVEVGCHHPFRFSNTFLLYKMGWSGICIDPLPGTAVLFRKWRSRDICVECGISNRPSALKYFMFNESALNTFDEAIAKSHNGVRGYKIVDVRLIETLTLEQVIERNLKTKPQKINLLSIDVEGLDWQVLQSNNWDKFRPEVIIAECIDVNFDEMNADPVVGLLSEKGYCIYAKTGNSVIFKEKAA